MKTREIKRLLRRNRLSLRKVLINTVIFIGLFSLLLIPHMIAETMEVRDCVISKGVVCP